MRAQFVKTISDVIACDPRLVLLLGDIGVFGFRNLLRDFPKRAYNIGILEQATVGVSAGLAMTGMIPVFHTIAPFIVERAYEQLKVDFGYQNLNGNFVSVGASYDYAALGCTHHCPADVGVLKLIPNMSILCPGTSEEFDSLFRQAYSTGTPKYYRLTETQNAVSHLVKFGSANIIRKGKNGIVIAVGNMLSKIERACMDQNVTILYYTSISPFDAETLRGIDNPSGRIVICEPYYSEGGLVNNVIKAHEGRAISIKTIGLPTVFSTSYGTFSDHDQIHGLDEHSIKEQIQQFLG